MSITRSINGDQKSEARGKNGWFKPTEIDRWTDDDGRVVIQIHSKVRGEMAPVCLYLTEADAELMRGLLTP